MLARAGWPRVSYVLVLGLGLGACGADDSTDDEPSPAQPVVDASGLGAQPPPPNGGKQGSGTTPTVMAVRRFFLGLQDPDGKPNPDAWVQYGYNLDGLISTTKGTNHCELRPNTPPTNKKDGESGIDDSFGQNIVPILRTLSPELENGQNQAVETGKSTLLIVLDNLDAAADQLDISGSVYASGELGGAPTLDGTDRWPVVESSIDPETNLARSVIHGSYVSNGVWVARVQGTLGVPIMLREARVVVPVHDAVISMSIQGVGSTASARAGVMAGWVAADDLVSRLEQAVGAASLGSLCPGSQYVEHGLRVVRQASDIVHGSANGDPNVKCDAISLGIGFEASAAQLGEQVVDPAVEDPCAH
ncbi:MAG: hypothetical protein R3B13_20250 [Polyangiaceae bacterium]